MIHTVQGQNAPAQDPLLEPKALEYDAQGNLVPASLPHIYLWFFRVLNLREELSKDNTTGSVRDGLRLWLGMTEADFAVFESAALRYGKKEKEFKTLIADIWKADLARHPANRALTQQARTAVHALLAAREEPLNSELAAMKAALSPASAAALDRRVVHEYVAYEYKESFFPDEEIVEAGAPPPKPQPDVIPRGPDAAAAKAPQSPRLTEATIEIKLPTTGMTVARANKIPLDLNGFAVKGRIHVDWAWPEMRREGTNVPPSVLVPLQLESDGSAYVNFVPLRLGKLKLRILVFFADGGLDDYEVEVNVDRLPDQPPDRLILSLFPNLTYRAGTLAFDLTPRYSRMLVIPVAFYKGVDSPIPLIPAPSQIQDQLSYTVIPRKNQASPIIFDPKIGEVKAERLGQALLKVTLGNHSAYACMDVMRDSQEFFQHSNCGDFLPPDLTEPIDKPFYIEKREAPPAN
jgi:hypothetical protein